MRNLNHTAFQHAPINYRQTSKNESIFFLFYSLPSDKSEVKYRILLEDIRYRTWNLQEVNSTSWRNLNHVAAKHGAGDTFRE
jgi:hypothetical protein